MGETSAVCLAFYRPKMGKLILAEQQGRVVVNVNERLLATKSWQLLPLQTELISTTHHTATAVALIDPKNFEIAINSAFAYHFLVQL